MKKKNHSLSVSLVLSAVLGSCATHQIEPVGPPGPELENYTAAAIHDEAQRLMTARDIGDREQQILLRQLDDLLEKHTDWLDGPGVTSVAVFHSAGGGFIYKGGGGDGLVSFAGSDQAVPFKVKGYRVGAAIGGGSHYGIALGIGLRDQRRFAGIYSSKGVSATSGAVQAQVANATYAGENGHDLRYIATGFGMSADATVGEFTIEFGE